MIIVAQSSIDQETELALKSLITSCEAFDGCEPSLQVVLSLNCHPEMNAWLLAYENEHLVAILTVFQPAPHEAEVSGCVHPEFRGRGIFKALVKEALAEIKRFGDPRILWMLNRQSTDGVAYIKHKQFALHQTEYTMKYDPLSPVLKSDVLISWRRAVAEDIPSVAVIQASAFQEKQDDAIGITTRFMADETRENYIGFFNDQPFASVSVYIKDNVANINALAVHQAYQGKGLGRVFISRLIEHYVALGYEITLEVNSENDRAFQLYKKIGFQIIEAIDYYV